MVPGPYRVGPWPGLTLAGARVLLGCAVLLALGVELVGAPRKPLHDLTVLAVVSILPLALATRIVATPGAASAACGAYLLPRTLLSLVEPRLELPPLLLVPALAFDAALWVRVADLLRIPPLRRRDRRRSTITRVVTVKRAAAAGAISGFTLALVEPPYAVLLGADPATWSGPDLLLASMLATGLSSVVAVALSVRGTAS